MGVLKQQAGLPLTDRITLDDYLLDDEIDSEIENDANNNVSFHEGMDSWALRGLSSRRRRQRDERSARKARRINDLARDKVFEKKKQMGTRKQRRYENAQLLYSLADPKDICEDYSDVIQSTVTALSKLFIEKENMEAWITFIEKDEEEQREFLDDHETEEVHRQCCSLNNTSNTGVGIYEDHLAFSAEASFSRLNRRLKTTLKHKALPLEFIADIEDELREFFGKNAPVTSEWTSSVISRLQRLIIHALSQYLHLFSKSVVIKGDDQKKFVKVRNKYCSFRPPQETLVNFLKRIRRID